MTVYQYEPLLSPDSIRLLVLQPSDSHDGKLKGSLLHTTLAEVDEDLIDKYTALSYVWGSDVRPCLIFLDGGEFAITQSLHDALRDMRDLTRARRVWADALCINQTDVAERNDQVMLMDKIYGMASSTIIYLGRLTEDAAKVVAAARRVNEDDVPESDIWDTKEARAAECYHKQAKANLLLQVACRDLLSRPWFKRVWVLQELVLSADPWIQCGRQRVRWDKFCHLLRHKLAVRSDEDEELLRFLSKGLTLITPSDEDKALLRVLDDMNGIRCSSDNSERTLWQVILRRRGFGVTDPRDYVYANLSIINDLGLVSKHVNIDYGDSIQNVFCKMATYSVSACGFSRLLTQVNDMHPEERLDGLPSWAPDWRYPDPLLDPLHSASPVTPSTECEGYHYVLRLGSAPPILAYTGYKIDSIDSVSAVVPFNRDVGEALLASEVRRVRAKPKSRFEFSTSTEAVVSRIKEGDTRSDVMQKWETEASWPVYDFKESPYCLREELTNEWWSRFFDALEQQWNEESSGDASFAATFCRWISERPFAVTLQGGETSGAYLAHFRIRHGIPQPLTSYLRYDAEEGLAKRRVAFTSSGRCGLVPKQARKGDAIIFNGTAAQPLIVRPKELAKSQVISIMLMLALRCQIPQETTPLVDEGEAGDWPSFLARETDCVEHYSVIGQGCFAGCSDFSNQLTREQMRVFALH